MSEKTRIRNDAGVEVDALSPVIISASRATDIPAFYARWFLHRLEKGHLVWVNPFNQQRSHVSFEKTRVIVFWTKNPRPLMDVGVLEALERYEFPGAPVMSLFPEPRPAGIHYYFQFTLNDYEVEGLEPGVPPLTERIETFKELSGRIGKEKVIWRFDPLLVIPGRLEPKRLLEKIGRVGEQIKGYTEKLVISFADIRTYRDVVKNLVRQDIHTTDMDAAAIHEIAEGLARFQKSWGIQIASCAEAHDLEKYGIEHNHCIDGALIHRLFGKEDRNGALRKHLLGSRSDTMFPDWNGRKDKGQRAACACVASKDIGQYRTCPHACVYCYANARPETARENYEQHKRNGETLESILHFVKRP
jgi:hypothetical protein